MKTSNGHDVLIDAQDLPLVERWSWIAVLKYHVWYACRNSHANGGKRVYMHRQILGEPVGIVDHLDGNGLNNQRSNLRVGSHSENQRNRRGAQCNSASGIRGIYWHKQRGKWAATLRHHRKTISLGLFNQIEDAIRARKEGEAHYWLAPKPSEKP